jgi:hypothetical protein
MSQKTEQPDQEVTEQHSDDVMSPSDIQALVDGLDPIDWVQLRLTASLPPRKRLLAGIQAQAFARATVRGALRRRYPDLSQSELNMKVLAHLTTVRMEGLLTED